MVLSVASGKMYFSIKKCIKTAPICDEIAWIRVFQSWPIGIYRRLSSSSRFNCAEAVRTGDGLFSVASGNHNVPTWLGEMVFGWLFTPKSENDKYARQIRSSAGIAIFVGQAADKANWVEVGRCYERFALQATALGIRNALVNQPVEVQAVRPQFATAFGLNAQRPDLVVRFGRGPAMPSSLRRTVQAVLV